MYSLDADIIYVCGDLNSHISNKEDCIGDIDNVSPQVAIDLSANSHGESLLDFLRNCKCCVLNGGITPAYDNFTSVSSKGKAIVDYIITPHDRLDACTDFKVTASSELPNNNPACIDFVDEKCRLPDHSLLLLTFKMHVPIEMYSPEVDTEVKVIKKRSTIFPDNFLFSNMSRLALVELINKVEECEKTQTNIDKWYGLFCDITDREINTKTKIKSDF